MRSCFLSALIFVLAGSAVWAEEIEVNALNFVTAQTALQFETYQNRAGGVNRLLSIRKPAPVDDQTTIRLNRDTLYSFAIVDISQGATVSLPEAGSRYMSLMVINEQHYINAVHLEPGRYELTPQEFGSDHVLIGVRILVDSNSPEDVAKVNELQDRIEVQAKSSKPFTAAAYDMASYKATLEPLLALGRGVPDSMGWFGSKAGTDPIGHLIGTAVGFGGLPSKHAYYLNVEPGLPVGEYALTAKDVPVRAFWSVTLYDKEGYFEKNPENAYNFNSVNAKRSSDGSISGSLLRARQVHPRRRLPVPLGRAGGEIAASSCRQLLPGALQRLARRHVHQRVAP